MAGPSSFPFPNLGRFIDRRHQVPFAKEGGARTKNQDERNHSQDDEHAIPVQSRRKPTKRTTSKDKAKETDKGQHGKHIEKNDEAAMQRQDQFHAMALLNKISERIVRGELQRINLRWLLLFDWWRR